LEYPVAPAHHGIQYHPGDKPQELRPPYGGHSVPENRATLTIADSRKPAHLQIFDALGVQMNFAPVLLRQAFQQFRKRAFGSVPPVHKWGDYRDLQLSESNVARAAPREPRRQIEPTMPASEGGTIYPAAPTRKRSERNPRRPANPQT
jgi:hypothetical protein